MPAAEPQLLTVQLQAEKSGMQTRWGSVFESRQDTPKHVNMCVRRGRHPESLDLHIPCLDIGAASTVMYKQTCVLSTAGTTLVHPQAQKCRFLLNAAKHEEAAVYRITVFMLAASTLPGR